MKWTWDVIGQLVLLACLSTYALYFSEAPAFAILGFAGLVGSRIVEPGSLIDQGNDSDSDGEGHED